MTYWHIFRFDKAGNSENQEGGDQKMDVEKPQEG